MSRAEADQVLDATFQELDDAWIEHHLDLAGNPPALVPDGLGSIPVAVTVEAATVVVVAAGWWWRLNLGFWRWLLGLSEPVKILLTMTAMFFAAVLLGAR